MPRHTRLAHKLLEVRVMAGDTQAEAAGKLGVSESTVTSWETSRRVPRANLLTLIEETYGLNEGELTELRRMLMSNRMKGARRKSRNNGGPTTVEAP